jgi:hypothetical protein
MRGQRKITACLDRITTDDKLTVDDLFSEAVDMLCSVLVGWKNMGEHKFSKETIEEILTYSEAREILRKIAYNQHVTTDQKKDSASQP